MRVGIDLGTTYSAVAYVNSETGKPEIIKNIYGHTITPSVLAFLGDGIIEYGENAKELQGEGMIETASFYKRGMGKTGFSINFYGKNYSASDLSAEFLKCLIKDVELTVGKTIDEAVITVPAYFGNKEREATLRAGEKAGLKVLGLLNEPTAAAFAYGLSDGGKTQTVLIYDLGGGTFDVTIAHIESKNIQILGSSGDHELGGKDWDDAIACWACKQFEEEFGYDVSDVDELIDQIIVASEKAKKQLSTKTYADISIFWNGKKGHYRLTNEIFMEISSYMLSLTEGIIDGLFEDIQITWKDIDGVILVGGSTRMKMVRDYVLDMTGREPLKGINVDEAVALGAAIRANIDEKGHVQLLKKVNQNSVEKMMLPGAKSIIDVTAHSLGMIAISPDGKRYFNSILISKNTQIPAENTLPYKFKTRKRNNYLEVFLLQGDSDNPLDCDITGKYVFLDIPEVASGICTINVTYRYNINGVIEVSAVQQETNTKLSLRVEPVPEDMSWVKKSPEVKQDEKVNINIFIAVDLSGSMYGKPMEEAIQAIHQFIGELDMNQTKIGLIAFSDKVKIYQKMTSNKKQILKKVDSLSIQSDLGYGNTAQPFTEILFEMGKTKNDHQPCYGIVLTDGVWSYKHKAIQAAQKCHKNGIDTIAIGFGSADEMFLKAISSIDELAKLSNLSDLSTSFSNIAQAIASENTGLK